MRHQMKTNITHKNEAATEYQLIRKIIKFQLEAEFLQPDGEYISYNDISEPLTIEEQQLIYDVTYDLFMSSEIIGPPTSMPDSSCEFYEMGYQ